MDRSDRAARVAAPGHGCGLPTAQCGPAAARSAPALAPAGHRAAGPVRPARRGTALPPLPAAAPSPQPIRPPYRPGSPHLLAPRESEQLRRLVRMSAHDLEHDDWLPLARNWP